MMAVCHLWHPSHQPIIAFPPRQNVSLTKEINKKYDKFGYWQIQTWYKVQKWEKGKQIGKLILWNVTLPFLLLIERVWIKWNKRTVMEEMIIAEEDYVTFGKSGIARTLLEIWIFFGPRQNLPEIPSPPSCILTEQQ